MEKMLQIHRLVLRFRRLPLLIVLLGLAVLAGAVMLTTLQVRGNVREQIAGRDGEVLYAVALLAYEDELAQAGEPEQVDAAAQFTVLLKTSQLKSVLGARLFDATGGFVHAFPPDLTESSLKIGDFKILRGLRPISRFHADVHLSKLFLTDFSNREKAVPLLEVNVPLHPRSGELAAVAQFLIEGQSIAAEFAQLDRHLILQGTGTFLAAGTLLSAAVGLAFRRLRRAHALLSARTEDLVKANQELAFAAKASALGTVTAHLIHSLKNPLAGLKSFVASQGDGKPSVEESDWQQAVASTRRMQTMIDEVVSLLREEETNLCYEITLAELGEMVAARVHSQVRGKEIEFTMQLPTGIVFPNRVANLVALILVNLVQNAVEATAPGKRVCVSATRGMESVTIEVRDEGAGFPSSTPPFVPCRSAKEGGSGIGLALCKQLANHLGTRLQLKSSTPEGCIFALEIPAPLWSVKSERAQERLPQNTPGQSGDAT